MTALRHALSDLRKVLVRWLGLFVGFFHLVLLILFVKLDSKQGKAYQTDDDGNNLGCEVQPGQCDNVRNRQ